MVTDIQIAVARADLAITTALRMGMQILAVSTIILIGGVIIHGIKSRRSH